MYSKLAKLAIVITVLISTAELCHAQQATTATRGIPAGTPAMTPFYLKMDGGAATDGPRVRIRRITSYGGPNGMTFDLVWGAHIFALDPITQTPPTMPPMPPMPPMYVGSDKTVSLSTGSGQYYVEFQNQFPMLTTSGTSIIIP